MGLSIIARIGLTTIFRSASVTMSPFSDQPDGRIRVDDSPVGGSLY
jgi:hypothetical protein